MALHLYHDTVRPIYPHLLCKSVSIDVKVGTPDAHSQIQASLPREHLLHASRNICDPTCPVFGIRYRFLQCHDRTYLDGHPTLYLVDVYIHGYIPMSSLLL